MIVYVMHGEEKGHSYTHFVDEKTGRGLLTGLSNPTQIKDVDLATASEQLGMYREVDVPDDIFEQAYKMASGVKPLVSV